MYSWILGDISIDKLKTYSTAPLHVEMGGCQVMVHVIIIGARIGAEAAHYHMGCSTLTHCDPIWTIWKLLLSQGILLKDILKCITVMHMVLIQHDDHGEMLHLLQCHSLQVMEVRVTVPESLVHRHSAMIVQASFRVLHVEGDHIQYTMQDMGFLEFPLSTALQDIGGKMVLSQSFNKGHICLPKVVYVALALLEPMGCVTISALRTRRWLVQSPKRGQMRHGRLFERTLLEEFLLQFWDGGECEVTHLFVLWFFGRSLTLTPLIPRCMGRLMTLTWIPCGIQSPPHMLSWQEETLIVLSSHGPPFDLDKLPL